MGQPSAHANQDFPAPKAKRFQLGQHQGTYSVIPPRTGTDPKNSELCQFLGQRHFMNCERLQRLMSLCFTTDSRAGSVNVRLCAVFTFSDNFSSRCQ